MSINKLSLYDVEGQTIRDDDTCKIISNEIFTKITLYKDKKITHDSYDRTYLFYFIDGLGILECDSKTLKARSNDIIFVVNETAPMRIINIGDTNLHYIIIKDYVIQ